MTTPSIDYTRVGYRCTRLEWIIQPDGKPEHYAYFVSVVDPRETLVLRNSPDGEALEFELGKVYEAKMQFSETNITG